VTRKRTPEAVIGAEEYLIVKHTHDIDLARRLMEAALVKAYGCPVRDNWPVQQKHACDDECAVAAMKHWALRLAGPKPIHVRVQGALPNSYAADEGWSYTFVEVDKPGRGAFKAVVFK
jgi:hypothetical protein